MDKLNTDTELAAVMADCAAVSLIVYTYDLRVVPYY